ncbi:hypothetical protein [Fodinicola acaciae]|uniref:hypothetical protein n=1 Tax=Fodinicola acaciae TaxID=2681555 RepID=UPI0013D13967|nr:hypothetical protein [Fodinicola acaciae]
MNSSDRGADKIVVCHRSIRATGLAGFCIAAAIVGIVSVVVGASGGPARGPNDILTFIGSIRIGLVVAGGLIALLSVVLYMSTGQFGASTFSASGVVVAHRLGRHLRLAWSDLESIDVVSGPRDRFLVLVNLRTSAVGRSTGRAGRIWAGELSGADTDIRSFVEDLRQWTSVPVRTPAFPDGETS